MRSPLSFLFSAHQRVLLMFRGTQIKLLITIFGGKCQRGLLVGKGFSFRYPPNSGIKIGHNVYFGKNTCLAITDQGLFTVGDNTAFTGEILISVAQKVEIGRNTLIGEFVSIRDGDHQYEMSQLIKEQPISALPIVIEDDVWIGRGVAILKGSHISKGSIIGANAVVKSFIPPYAIAAGIPAKVIKYRYQDNKSTQTL